MSIVKNKMLQRRAEEAEIISNVSASHITLNEEEQEAANRIVIEISEEFSEELRSNTILSISDKISASISEKCSKLTGFSFLDQKRIEKSVVTTVLGNGPIQVYMDDPEVTEIVVQRYDNIVIERNGKIEQAEAAFNSEEHLVTIIKRLIQKAGRQINTMIPVENAAMEDGSRINATLPPVSVDGATLTIRKFSKTALTGYDYLRLGSLNKKMLGFLIQCVRGKICIFVSGSTGTGKTTLLNMLSGYIPEEELIITIEDTCELRLQQRNVRRMQVRTSGSKEMMQIDQQKLVKEALRQRPDRIILGEARDGTIVDMISAMSTGHDGSMSTIHANDPYNMCNVRVPILYGMNKDARFSEKTIGMQLSEAVQIVVQIARLPDGSRKLTHISHLDGFDKYGHVNIRDIFLYDRKEADFKYTGYYPEKIVEKIREKGVDFPSDFFGKEDSK
ncbi:MAG: Flp pilus assembly complex ATPase component TadA [Lachnospiraceae bacterium]|nr:Flp pilus assembly complex ATPase component TadA [Lachnospiraceae bacterium]